MTGGGDLLADVRNGAVKLDAVPAKELPLDLQGMDQPARTAWVEEKLKVREDLEKRMEALVTKRDAYASEQAKLSANASNQDSFDRAVEETIKVQVR